MMHEDLKVVNAEWIRSGAIFSNVMQQLEEELKRMKEKKLAQEFIDKKDDQIESLVQFYNNTDSLVNYFKMALINMRIENHFLTEMLLKKCTLNDVMQYKPSRAVEIINKETGESHTLSELPNGKN